MMKKGKRTVKRRIFLSNTGMVLVTLMIFLAVNLCILKLYENTLRRKAAQSSELAPYTEEVKKILEEWTLVKDKEQYKILARDIGAKDYVLYIRSDDKIVYSGRKGEERDDLEKYLKEDGRGHIFSNDNLTVVSRYDTVSGIEIYAISDRDEEEHGSWEGHYAAFLIIFIIDGVFCVGGLLLISQLFTRSLTKHILKPLTLLSDGAQRVQQGNLTQPVVYTGDIEHENVCKTFNDMQLYILAEQEKNRKYEKARTDMITGISHDLRTPMTAIQGTIKGLIDGVVSTPEQQQKFLKTAYRRTRDMDVLLQHLFYFSKLETGNMPLELKKINMSDFIRNYLKSKREMLEGDNICIEEMIEEDSIYVEIDTEQMQRIFDNLIENSMKYANIQSLVIKVTLKKVDGRACLCFSDNGNGVPGEKLPHIFEEFYRGDESRNEKEGNGLGLYIIKYLMEAMGGNVWAESGQGLAILMELPAIGGWKDESKA